MVNGEEEEMSGCAWETAMARASRVSGSVVGSSTAARNARSVGESRLGEWGVGGRGGVIEAGEVAGGTPAPLERVGEEAEEGEEGE